MTDGKATPAGARAAGKFLGSLREALAAAARHDTSAPRPRVETAELLPVIVAPPPEPEAPRSAEVTVKTAVEAAREARGYTPNIPPMEIAPDVDAAPTTRIVRQPAAAQQPRDTARTQIVRGKGKVVRGEFHQDPVVGWLVVVGGPGLGAFRPIFEGNNAVGRSSDQRIPIDFGDEAISAEEQAFIRYDSSERSFLLVPNLSKTNVVALNDKRPTAAVELAAMDVITMGRTQLVFVPFCSRDFDWSELPDVKS
jgi:hypothetical protein